MTWIFGHWRALALGGIVIACVLSLGTMMVLQYGAAKFEAGVQKERAANLEVIAQATERARQAESELSQVRAERDRQREERDRLRAVITANAREEIRNAENAEDRYAAYLNHRNSLREQSTTRHDRVRSDYLSTIAVEP